MWSAPATATLTMQSPGNRQVPADYVGFSYETVQLADPTFFAADNRELVAIFRALSPRGVLRIGGNSANSAGGRHVPTRRPRPIRVPPAMTPTGCRTA